MTNGLAYEHGEPKTERERVAAAVQRDAGEPGD